jgi:hypothetical protein
MSDHEYTLFGCRIEAPWYWARAFAEGVQSLYYGDKPYPYLDLQSAPVSEPGAARHAYEMRVTHLWTGHRASEEAAQLKQVADAALAEADQTIERIQHMYDDSLIDMSHLEWKRRAEQAEAELAYMTTQRDDEHAALLRRHADLAALKAEVDAPWHIGAFIEVDGRTVGPHMVRSWREELAALKARQCETCRWQEQGAMDPDSCAVLQGVIPCRDFGCNQWQPREAAE